MRDLPTRGVEPEPTAAEEVRAQEPTVGAEQGEGHGDERRQHANADALTLAEGLKLDFVDGGREATHFGVVHFAEGGQVAHGLAWGVTDGSPGLEQRGYGR